MRKVEEIERNDGADQDGFIDYSMLSNNRKNTADRKNTQRRLLGSMRVSNAQAIKHSQVGATHSEPYIEKRGGLWYNLKELFNYRPAS